MKYIVLSAIAALTLVGCKSLDVDEHSESIAAMLSSNEYGIFNNHPLLNKIISNKPSKVKPKTSIKDANISVDNNPSNQQTKPSIKHTHGHGVIVSQDITDEDNYSIVRAAINMDKAGYIDLLAVTVTGKDTNNRGGLLFSIAGDGKTPPILINKNPNLDTRVTNASGVYAHLDYYPSDELTDTQRDDSSLYLESIIENYDGNITYIAGGHLHNLADLLKRNASLVNTKVKTLVLDTGWDDRTSGNPETNLSQGTTDVTGTSKATAYVFKHFKGKILVSSDPYAKWSDLDISILGSDTGLYYLVKNGRYYRNSKVFNMSDFPALFYGSMGNKYKGKVVGKEIQTCYELTPWSAIMAKSGKCNHYYIENSNNTIIEAFFKSMMKSRNNDDNIHIN